MLPAAHRLRRPADFSRVVRSGARAGRSTMVVHLVATGDEAPTRVGFVVSKAVGNAVTRNLVERRLRAAVRTHVGAQPVGYDVVVRALPGSAGATFAALDDELGGAWQGALRRASARTAGPEQV